MGHGITDTNSVIELFTKIKIPTIGGNSHRSEIQSYDPEISSFMTQLIYPLNICFGDVLCANRSPIMEPVKVICVTLYIDKPSVVIHK